MPAFPELSEPITDGVVALRLTAERDIPEILIAYQDDHELHLKLGEDRPPSGAALGRRAEQADAERRAGISLTFAITQPPDDTTRGEVRVGNVDWENRRAELSVWVAAQLRGRGFARRSLTAASRWLLAEGGLERVELMIDPADERTIRAALGAGFTRESVLRRPSLAVVRRGQPARVDNVVLSRIREDLQP